MRDDKIVLLEEDSIKAFEVVNLRENLGVQPEGSDTVVELSAEQEPEQEHRPYRFLQNCNSVALYLCILYNLCMVLLLVFVFVYKRRN